MTCSPISLQATFEYLCCVSKAILYFVPAVHRQPRLPRGRLLEKVLTCETYMATRRVHHETLKLLLPGSQLTKIHGLCVSCAKFNVRSHWDHPRIHKSCATTILSQNHEHTRKSYHYENRDLTTTHRKQFFWNSSP